MSRSHDDGQQYANLPPSRSDRFHDTVSQFQVGLSKEELEKFESVAVQDVRKVITTIQSRQESERAMMDLIRTQDFIIRMEEFADILQALPEHFHFMTFIWGPMKTMLYTASQIPKAFDLLLEAYAKLGSKMPSLHSSREIFKQQPDLWRVLEFIYEDVLEFHRSALDIFVHPNMRTLFKSMWSDYKPSFKAKLKNLESHGLMIQQVLSLGATLPPNMSHVSMNIQYVAGHMYDNIDVSDGSQVQFGDRQSSSIEVEAMRSEILAKLSQLEHTLKQTNTQLEDQEKRRRDDRLKRVQDWIAGHSPHLYHEKVCDIRHDYPETGLWVLRNPFMMAWLTDDMPVHPVLWLHGIPGAGKTVLASVVIEACKEIEDSNTAYFYCNYNDQETNTSVSMLKSILMQATYWRPDLMSYIDDQRQTLQEHNLCKRRTGERLTDLVCRGGKRTYIVIDGVDECALEERSNILTFLQNLVHNIDQKEPGNLRLLVVSQNETDIMKNLGTAATIEVQDNFNRDDIKIFVTRQTEMIRERFDLTVEKAEEVRSRICWHAKAQFLYAKLVLNNLYAQCSRQAFEYEFDVMRFPKELSEAYGRIIERIKTNLMAADWDTALQLLGWMTCAARPLRWHEIQGALSINFYDDIVDFEGQCLRDRNAADLCGPLVSVSEDRVSLVHRTAQQYILESEHIDTPLVEVHLANLCIRYLCFEGFEPDHERSTREDFLLEGYYAFADYATAKWMHHLYRVADQAQALSDATRWDIENGRKDSMEEFCESIGEFCKKHSEDMQISQRNAEKFQIINKLNADTIQLLSLVATDSNASQNFQMLWTHAQTSYVGDTNARHTITLQKLHLAMEQIRETLEAIASSKWSEPETLDKLKTYYGEFIYRCSKTSCYFYHQGFRDSSTRDLHVARHERSFYCPEADCPASEFGFPDSKAYEAHIVEAHPDSEARAKMFKPPVVKPLTTKYRCDTCDKYFVRRSIMQAHMRSHAGQKPYECSKCGRPFVRKNDCNRHEKTVHNKVKAP